MDYSLSPVPASQDTLNIYLAFLARKISANSIPNYMNVIRLIHLQAGFPNPLIDNFELGLIKKGISREKGTPPLQKLPIDIPILRKIHAILDLNTPSDLSFWASCLLGFLGFMRKSTMLPPKNFTTEKILTRNDILDLNIDSFILQVHHSKVIQFGEKIHLIPFARSSDFNLCPVRAIMAHFGASPLEKNRPLFNYKFAGNELLVTQSTFAKRLKSILSSVLLNSSLYSAHSLRRGGASYAFEIGISPIQIKLRGDWASDAFERYVFISSGATKQVASSLSTEIITR